MKQLVIDAFAGIDKGYYLRHFIFGLAIAAFFLLLAPQFRSDKAMIILLAINTLLYPYAHVVYDDVMGFIMGDNKFYINAIVFMVLKFWRMLILFIFSIFIAPLGLIYLAFYHHRNRKKQAKEAVEHG